MRLTIFHNSYKKTPGITNLEITAMFVAETVATVYLKTQR
jgi:hypothetical protein